ncbi:GAF domain-containing sensor histidine kinase [Mucilaginibacter corticis]|uniref:histidine kinase n=1 Tax=Mucilaginibacter corticis TaxID=2597670 RepID=A0A556MG24_9SPHI|nr:GAF domain-containing sensor histidine kinase [Mucilaginibacter corticis]TSJ38853.1 GAF domain-containing sensor histidine kinase [Mucilaginibacter corticis]
MPLLTKDINETDRLDALRSYHILDTAEEKDFDELTELASAICQTPVALISLVDAERQWFKSHTGVDVTETHRNVSFCAHAIASFDDIMIVEDAKADERFADNALVTGETNITFYAGVPLITEDGHALGTLCVIDTNKRTLTAQQTTSLKILAKQVMDKLELRRKIMHLEAANQELLNSNVLIQKFASMAAHDIKNPLSSILLTSQALKIRQEKIQDAGCIRLVDLNITSTKNLMVLVEDMLAYSKEPSLLIAKRQRFNPDAIFQKILAMLTVPENISVELPEIKTELHLSLIAFEQIFINLLSNAIRYNNKEKGIVKVRFAEDDEFYRFEVTDNGIGIAEQYHEKIFSNNFTLKITDRYNKKGSGIGLSTVKDLINALNGNIYVKSVLDEGTTFFLSLKK